MLTFLLLICLAFWLKSELTIPHWPGERVCTLLFWLLAKYGRGDERQNKRRHGLPLTVQLINLFMLAFYFLWWVFLAGRLVRFLYFGR